MEYIISETHNNITCYVIHGVKYTPINNLLQLKTDSCELGNYIIIKRSETILWYRTILYY